MHIEGGEVGLQGMSEEIEMGSQLVVPAFLGFELHTFQQLCIFLVSMLDNDIYILMGLHGLHHNRLQIPLHIILDDVAEHLHIEATGTIALGDSSIDVAAVIEAIGQTKLGKQLRESGFLLAVIEGDDIGIGSAIQRNRVGLKDPNHPIGVFMFLGPTGVGKTYLAKKLAEFMFGTSEALIRVDMSEYTEAFNVSRLIGAPPGYVGYEEGGQLTERVRRHPYSIVLLDEIEKAHGNVFNLLLQVLDEGRLTDGNGRFVDFRNTVIIMTSNAGTRQLKDFGRGVGFTSAGSGALMLNEQDKEHARQIVQKALSKQFSPEFLNRLDEIITFDQLDLEAIKQIIDVELEGLYKRISDMGYTIDLSEEAKKFVAEKGYDVQFGARPLKRAIQNYIEDGISELIVDGELPPGSVIHINKAENQEKLSFTV